MAATATSDDQLTIGSGGLIRYDAGDGKDIVHSGSNSTLAFGEGISADDLRIEVSGNTTTISFAGNDTDSITLDTSAASTLTLAFADGSMQSLGGQAANVANAYQQS